jgi:hypothetical protein
MLGLRFTLIRDESSSHMTSLHTQTVAKLLSTQKESVVDRDRRY